MRVIVARVGLVLAAVGLGFAGLFVTPAGHHAAHGVRQDQAGSRVYAPRSRPTIVLDDVALVGADQGAGAVQSFLAWVHGLGPRDYARLELAVRGRAGEMGCLDWVVDHESKWSVTAGRVRGAYGIPQALPGRKMADEGPDWLTNGQTQVRWMLGYMDGRYGGPCGAMQHWKKAGSY